MRWRRWATGLYLALLVPAGVYLIVTRWDTIAALSDGVSVPFLILAFGLTLVPPAISSFFWLTAFRANGVDLEYRQVTIVTARSLLSRYVPGGVWYSASRVVMLGPFGVQRGTGALVAATELAMTLLIAIAIGAPLAAIGFGEPAIGAILFVGAGVGIGIGKPIVTWLAARLNRDVDGANIDTKTYGRLVFITVVYWLALMLTFIVFMRAMSIASDVSPAMLGGGYALAWVVGWLAPFAPQGIGVFETTLSAILGNENIVDLTVAIIGFRAVLLVRDLLSTAVGTVLGVRRRPQDGQ